MRRLVLVLTMTGLLGTALVGSRAFAACGSRHDNIRCEKDEQTTEPGTASQGGGGSRGPDGTPGMVPVVYPRPVTGPDGTQCITSVVIQKPESDAEQEKTFARELWELYLGSAPPCPDAPGVPPVSPRVLAIGFWQDIPLPKPAPSIAPGWAITGKTAYLETHGERRHDYSRGTPFGSLGLTATGQYYVDWGDGDTTGPYDVEGGAWPDGQITHTYINVGHYNIVVTEKWSSTWHLGGESGNLSGLETEGVIDNFRVEQVQAVISGH